MRKVIFSAVTKTVAFILAVACLVLGVNVIVNAIDKYEKEELKIYDFERTFSQSNHFRWMLTDPVWAVSGAIDKYWPNGEKSLEQLVKESLNAMQSNDRIDYLVIINGKKITNCWEYEKDYFENQRFYYSVEGKGNGRFETRDSYNTGYLTNVYDAFKTYSNKVSVYVSIKETYVQQCEAAWNRQADLAMKSAVRALAFAGGALLMIVFLCVIAGKNGKGELKASWFDRIWTEIHLGVMAAAVILSVPAIWAILEEFIGNRMPVNLTLWLTLSISGAAGVLIITCLLSLVRKIKCGIFLKTSVIFIVLSWVFRILFRFLKWFGRKLKNAFALVWKFTTKKSGALIILTTLVYTVVAVVIGVLLTDDETAIVGIILGILAFAAVCYIVIKRAKELEEIKGGVAQVRSGNLSHKIPELKHEDLNVLASDINDIALGLDQSVAAKIKAERMKTELITNVSHDLKTPLTSIINYTELLSKVDKMPDEAMDYVKIIAKKSERLKNLTQDLFDMSKVQSGNEEITPEQLDVALLVNQSLGEHDNEIKASGLNFC